MPPITHCQSVGGGMFGWRWPYARPQCRVTEADRDRKRPDRPRRPLCARRHERRRRGGAHRRCALSRHRSRSRQERHGAGRGARRAEGPDHEGGAAARHHPRRAAAGIRQRTDQAAEPGAADGLGLRQAAHEGRARPRLAEKVRKLRASPGRRGFARAGASRALARRRRACLQAAICRHAVGGRSRPQAAAMAVRHPPPLRSGDRHHRDRQGDRRAPARGARLLARGQARRALPRHAGRQPGESGCRRSGPSSRPAGC